MEVAYIGVPFRIEGYKDLGGSPLNYPNTWYNTVDDAINYGNDVVNIRDIMVETEEQFYQAVHLVKLGITGKETLQQLLGVQS